MAMAAEVVEMAETIVAAEEAEEAVEIPAVGMGQQTTRTDLRRVILEAGA